MNIGNIQQMIDKGKILALIRRTVKTAAEKLNVALVDIFRRNHGPEHLNILWNRDTQLFD